MRAPHRAGEQGRRHTRAPGTAWATPLYCVVVIDVLSRSVGWPIDDNVRTELVVDALGMAILRRQPERQ
ncbi:hypothetical protein GCM10009836_45490 [Pseudonocardia ailaonensis]|uniref:Integrase catalytic domain-containing protein n=1 Tax=Pseudonocardia ailaonensis TaxID=367279 RepID=A0ABN2NAC0_9PSEU